MNFGELFKSIFLAIASFFGWKSNRDRLKEEAERENEDYKSQLRRELAEAEASGDIVRYNHIRSRLRTAEANSR